METWSGVPPPSSMFSIFPLLAVFILPGPLLLQANNAASGVAYLTLSTREVGALVVLMLILQHLVKRNWKVRGLS